VQFFGTKSETLCSDACKKADALDRKYWFQDLLNLAVEHLGISKKALLEDYYPDETMLLIKRKAILDKRRSEQLKNKDQEPVEEVGWDAFWGKG
jgi:hypothetical protein